MVYIFPFLSVTSYGAHPIAVKYASIFVVFSGDGVVNISFSAVSSAARVVIASTLVFASALTIFSYQFVFHIAVSIADIAHNLCGPLGSACIAAK